MNEKKASEFRSNQIRRYYSPSMIALGYINNELLIASANWDNLEVRTEKGSLIMSYSNNISDMFLLRDVYFVGNRYLVCELGSGIMAYVIRIWDFQLSKWIFEVTKYAEENIVFGHHPTKPILATGYLESSDTIEIWDIQKQKIIGCLKGYIDYVSFNTYDRKIATISDDRCIGIVDEKGGEIISAQYDFVNTLEWINSSQLIISTKDKIILLNARTLQEEAYFNCAEISEIKVSSCERWALCIGESNMILIDLKDSSLKYIDDVGLAAFHPEKNILSYVNDKSIKHINLGS